MAITRRTARASRIGLVVIGLLLLLGGGIVLARGLKASASVLGDAQATLLTGAQARYPARNGWVWPVTAAASAIIALLALWWLAAQTRTRTLRRLPIEPERRRGATVLDADAATDAIAGELENCPGVQAADATLRGPALAPSLRLAVTAENRADPAGVRARIETGALAHLRTALEPGALPTVVRLKFSRFSHRYVA